MKKTCWVCFIFLGFVCSNIVAQQADLIIRNANIITAVEKGQRKQALAVKDGLIIFTGTNSEVLQYQSGKTQMIDAKGSTIVPGLNDVHLHPVT